MGGRLSRPQGPGGTSEGGRIPTISTGTAPRRPLNTRQFVVPFAAVALGSIFYVYSHTSIQAAKDSAKRTREADGGSISWRNESRRRHGALEKPEERTLFSQLFGGKENDAAKERREKEAKRLEMLGKSRSEPNYIEEGIRRARKGRTNVERSGKDDE